MSDTQVIKPSFDTSQLPVNPARRKMLIAASSAAGAVGGAFVLTPFVASWLPSERAKAVGAPVTVDISKLEEGALQTVLWQGKVVYLLRRSKEMLSTLTEIQDLLRDPNSTESVQPPFADNIYRALKKEVMVMLGVCTHLGCAPSLQSRQEGREKRGDNSWVGGFFCNCHGSKYDYSGRVFKNVPAPKNLVVPPYQFESENVVIVGESKKEGNNG